MERIGALRHQKLFAWKPRKVCGKWIWLRWYYHNEEYRRLGVMPIIRPTGIEYSKICAWACYPDGFSCYSLKPFERTVPDFMPYDNAMQWVMRCKTDYDLHQFLEYFDRYGHMYKPEQQEFMIEMLSDRKD